MSFTPSFEVNLAALCIGMPILVMFAFIGMAVYAFVREQAPNPPSTERLAALAAHNVDHLPQPAFRQLVADALCRCGYALLPSPADPNEIDGGTDLVLSRDGARCFVLVVHYPRAISRATVELAEARRRQYACASAMVVTNGSFHPQARHRATALGHTLIDWYGLAELLAQS